LPRDQKEFERAEKGARVLESGGEQRTTMRKSEGSAGAAKRKKAENGVNRFSTKKNLLLKEKKRDRTLRGEVRMASAAEKGGKKKYSVNPRTI